MIIFSEQKLYIGKVLAIYENISGKHAYISYNITNIDAISYISVSLFVDIYNGSIFTNDCQIGGKLFAHITPKEVIYYFGKPDTITFQNNSMLTLTDEALQIYNFLNSSKTQKKLITIFRNQTNNNVDKF